MENQEKKDLEKVLSESGQLAVVKNAMQNAGSCTGPHIFFKNVQWKDAIKFNKKGTNIGVKVKTEDGRESWELYSQIDDHRVIGCTGFIEKTRGQELEPIHRVKFIEENLLTENKELEAVEGVVQAWSHDIKESTIVFANYDATVSWTEKNYLSICKKLIASVFHIEEEIKFSGIEEINIYASVREIHSVMIIAHKIKKDTITEMRLLDSKGLCLLELKNIKFKETATGKNREQKEEEQPITILNELKDILSEVTGISANEIDETQIFENYGLDSLSISELTEMINSRCSIDITPDVIFSYATLEQLNDFLVEHYQNALQEAITKDIAETEITKRDNRQSLVNETCTDQLIKMIELLQGIAYDDIEPDVNFVEYGFDSISIVEFAESINQAFEIAITPDIIFAYSTIEHLSEYLVNHFDLNLLNKGCEREHIENELPNIEVSEEERLEEERIEEEGSNHVVSEHVSEEIGIIGMSGRFPDARNVEELWDILNHKQNVVKQVPEERKEWRKAYTGAEPEKESNRKIGVIPGIAEFDPLFFEIAPVEAEKMDPRQRLLLQEMWKGLEDAGYNHRNLKDEKVGLFIGAEDSEYKKIGNGESEEITSNSNAVMAARFAYFLNLDGPNMTINTACSSGLVALHEACLSIRNQECTMAIVAAANLLITPDSYFMMEKSGMLSKKGVCSTFDQDADGMVPAEAVAVIVLKQMDKAIADHDRVYATIVGDGVNYDGKTNGITAPSGYAQEKLIVDVMNRFQIPADDISCVIAHGTGTKLGDPIEVNALNSAYKQLTDKRNYCALISVKPNLGHAMAASGIISLISAVLSMRKQSIPATINCDAPNDYIHWKDSPFYLNQEQRDWKVEQDKRPMAAISALGFSGTNAHVIVRSYMSEQEEQKKIEKQQRKEAYLLTFSAKTEEALKNKIGDLKQYVTENSITEEELESISYTLLCHREHFGYRAAIVVEDVEDLLNIETEDGTKYRSGLVQRKFKPLEETEKQIRDLCTSSKNLSKKQYIQLLERFAQYYCDGYDDAVAHLWENDSIIMKSISYYPFEKETYWLTESNRFENSISVSVDKIHPMIHTNISDFSEQKYCSHFTGTESFLREHRIKGIPVLPGVAYLEMAYKAALISVGVTEEKEVTDTVVSLKEVGWFSPISIEGDTIEVNTSVALGEDHTISYRIFTNQEEKCVHSQGYIEFEDAYQTEKIDLSNVLEKVKESQSIADVYERFSQNGLVYGREFSCITELYYTEDMVIAKLVAGDEPDNQKFALKPGVLDGAFQSTSVFEILHNQKNQLKIPFAVESITIYQACHDVMWSVAKEHERNGNVVSYDLNLYDEEGNLCIKVSRFTSRVLTDQELIGTETVLLNSIWEEEPIKEEGNYNTDASYITVLCQLSEEETGFSHISDKTKKPDRIYSLSGEGKQYEEYALELFHIIKGLFEEKHTEQIFLQVVYHQSLHVECLGGLTGLLQSATRENPQLVVQLVEVDQAENVADELIKEKKEVVDSRVRITQGKREVCKYKKEELLEKNKELWKNDGVYLITGGTGGLGLLFAEEIVKHCKACKILLTGRSDKSKISARLDRISCSKHQVIEYKQLDVSNAKETNEVVKYAYDQFGTLNGIIHAAGIIHDNYIMKKQDTEFLSVLSPKVSGVRNLDAAVGNHSIDFMIYFSSTSGVIGNAGQADYGAASGFMDAYASMREERVQKGECFGKTISIDWSLWKHGGMAMGKEKEKLLAVRSGIMPLETEQGIEAFYHIVSSNHIQTQVLFGQYEKMKRTLLAEAGLHKKNDSIPSGTVVQSSEENVIVLLKDILAESLKIPNNRIDEDAPMEEYGIDSILTMDMTNALETYFGMLPKTLFFEYQTIRELSQYFMKAHSNKLSEILSGTVEQESPLPNKEVENKTHVLANMVAKNNKWQNDNDDIAIIGIAGKYPKAEDIEQFWNNISQGMNCIEEIPRERWDYRQYYDPDKKKKGKSYSKWGGFIDGVDQFDPLFFGISPREAVGIDPQERLFLMCVYKAIEDAGYTKENIIDDERAVGVFTGVMYEDYQLYAANEQTKGNMITVNGSEASIANRISYYFNFNGPSIAMDTMCSSSLTSVHLACQSLKNQECKVAVAGGVNVTVHPNKYLLLSNGKYAASDGYCKSFGQGGDGYVPGEGVGAVILKPLREAKRDHDHIYGVIKATAINHGGKTNGYTVPNPNAQASLIKTVLKKATINPRTISYVEAHGTGTSLGDPIEIAGLTKAFEEYTTDRQFCNIGSVKSNIGHCEGAAGIASITKVLMQLKYKKIVPSLHSNILNPLIQFESTPFTVPQKLIEWEKPQIEENGQIKTYPRIAAISAFGAGGANAHLIIEEYEETEKANTTNSEVPVAVILSAKSDAQLEIMRKNLQTYLLSDHAFGINLISIAYTLQTGRESMSHRIGFVVNTMEQLLEQLSKPVTTLIEDDNAYYGNTENVEQFSRIETEEIVNYMEARDYDNLLNQWVHGKYVNWEKLYDNNSRPQKISLPTYVFEQEKYWIPVTAEFELDKMLLEPEELPKEEVPKEVSKEEADLSVYIQNVQEATEMIEDDLKEMVSRVLQIPFDKISIYSQLKDFGFDSISLVEFVEEINNKLELQITPDLMYSYPTIHELAKHLESEYESVRKYYLADSISEVENQEKTDAVQVEQERIEIPTLQVKLPKQQSNNTVYAREAKDEDIAIIGMSGRFPNARNIDELWRILKNKEDVITEVHRDGFVYKQGEAPMKMGVIPGVAEFDPMFFHISPKDAEEMDPKQRILLEEAYKAFENAGIGEEQLKKNRVGVFVGAEDGDYCTKSSSDVAITSNHNAVLSARFAYLLNLTGPNFTINTACSSALVALHEACLSIGQDECDMAIVAGANIITTSDRIRAMKNSNMLSATGVCRAFDKRADGMVPAEAVGVVVLKKIERAKEDKNPILATIIGSGINYDGKTNGITAPSGKSQTELLKNVYQRFDIDPEDISYIVTHGTGTKLGDPIEINALVDTFHDYTKKVGYCALTSTKSNIGHAMAASGIVSLISLVKAMQESTIPASIHCEEVNDYIHWEESPFYINRENSEWKAIDNKPRIGCVSAFGVSGTNAHIVVKSYEQMTQNKAEQTRRSHYVLMLSAKSSQALHQKANDLADMIAKQAEEVDLNSLSYTLFKGRLHYNHRLAIVCSNAIQAEALLRKAAKGERSAEMVYGEIARDFKEKSILQILISNMLKEYNSFLGNAKQFQELLLLFAQLYCDGYNEGFDKIWQNTNPSIITLPNYPFSKETYWVTSEEKIISDTQMESGISGDRNETILIYPRWERKELLKNETMTPTVQHMILLVNVKPEDIGLDQLSGSEIPTIMKCLECKQETYCDYAEQLFLEIKYILKNRECHKVFLQVVYQDADRDNCYEGLNGLLKSAVKENPKLMGQIIRIEGELSTDLGQRIVSEKQTKYDESVCFVGDWRYVQVYSELESEGREAKLPWKENGTYLIVGGAGGLGLIFAQEILNHVKVCNLILTGRKEFEQITEQLNQLRIIPTQTVEYISMNVESESDTKLVVNDIVDRFGTIDGVIHAAGILKDSYIIQKEADTFRKILGPKVLGVQNLDEATKDIKLDFMILFSSTAGLLGNAGQSDYATANAYMDAFAKKRNLQVQNKERSGQTLSMDWSFWKEGGMSMIDEKVQIIKKQSGISPLETADAIYGLYKSLESGRDQMGIFSGDVDRIRRETEIM